MGSWQSGRGPEPPWRGGSDISRCARAFAARDATKLPRECRWAKVDWADVGGGVHVLAFWSVYQPIAFWRPGKRRLVDLDCREYSPTTTRHRSQVFWAARKAGIPVVCAPLPFPVTFGPHREGELSPTERWTAAARTDPLRIPGGVALRRSLRAAEKRWRAKEAPYEEVATVGRRLRDLEVVAKACYVERVAKRYARTTTRQRKEEAVAVTWNPATGEFSP